MAAWTSDKIVEFMNRIDLFEGVAQEAISDLAASAFQEELAAGETVFSRGDEGRSLYLVAQGKVRVGLNGPDGEEDISILEVGDFFGEIAMLTQAKRTATITVDQDALLINFQAEDLLPLAEQYPELKTRIGRTGAQRSRDSMNRMLGK